MNKNQNQNQNGGQNPNFGKQIGDSVKNALNSGDMNHLSGIGPAVQGAVQKGLGAAGQAMQQAAGQMSSQQPQGGQPYQQQSARPAWQGQQPPNAAPAGGYRPAPAAPKRQKQRHYFGMLALVIGMVGVLLFAALLFIVGIFSFIFSSLATAAALLVIPLAACAVSLGVGISRRALAGRAGKYYEALREKNVRTVEELSEITRKPVAQVKKDISRIIKHEIYPDLYVDAGVTCLIRGEDAWRLYLESEKSRAAREVEEAERQRRMADPATAGIEAFRQEGAEAIKKLRAANGAIKDAAISEKLEKLEGTTGRIFAYVEKHPDKLPDTRRFMSYYLPTTLKLVEKYRHFEELEVQPDNVLKAKGEIEKSMGTIDLAFNNLLESLYQEDTLDVSTDIEVLQAMMEQEGLMGKKFDIEADGLH